MKDAIPLMAGLLLKQLKGERWECRRGGLNRERREVNCFMDKIGAERAVVCSWEIEGRALPQSTNAKL
jgi:hypothetical protein